MPSVAVPIRPLTARRAVAAGVPSTPDGMSDDLKISRSDIQCNTAKAGGSSIFYVSNDKTGHLLIDNMVSKNNTYAAPGYPGPHSFQNYPGVLLLGQRQPYLHELDHPVTPVGEPGHLAAVKHAGTAPQAAVRTLSDVLILPQH